MAATSTILGYANHLYYNTGSYGSPTWTLISNVADCKVLIETDEVDATTRAGGGFFIAEPGLHKISIEWSMIYDGTDTAFLALRTAALARTSIEFLALDGLSGTTGSLGIRATCKLFGFPKDEAIAGITKVDMKAKPALYSVAPASYTAA